MTVLVTGSSGHLGEAILRLCAAGGRPATGFDLAPGRFTDHIGSVADRTALALAMDRATAVVHCATLHKPHVGTHGAQEFIDTNVTGTLAVLEIALSQGGKPVIFTSTTSAFGSALRPPPGAPAAWIEDIVPGEPKNIYGVTKTAAEDLCRLFHWRHGLPVLVLRTSRFFPEEDDSAAVRTRFSDANAKANEFLFRRVDLEDAAMAHLLAVDKAAQIGFGRYVISATTPFIQSDCKALRDNAPQVVERRVPGYGAIYRKAGYEMFDGIDRVYSNAPARRELGWRPVYDFQKILTQIAKGVPLGSKLAREVGCKGYHDRTFADGPYPVDHD